MRHMLNAALKGLTIFATLHLSVVDTVLAQTSQPMSEAAGQANTGLFKPNPADLYSRDGQQFSIPNASPDGSTVTFSSQDLNYNVLPQSSEDGSLPDITTYEDLYSHRDQEIGHLERGTGRFNSTGRTRAETHAMGVLRNSEDIPPVGTHDFLFRSREIKAGETDDTAEFGQCIIQQVTGEVTYDFDNTHINTCDTLAIDTSPIIAERQFNGPRPLFSHFRENGQSFCRHGGRTIKVTGPEICGRLSVLREIPVATGGEVSAKACPSAERCVELVLDQKSSPAGAITNFSVRPGIDLYFTRLITSGLNDEGYVSYQGSVVRTQNGDTTFPPVTANPQINHEIGVSGGTSLEEQRQPPSGHAYARNSTGVFQRGAISYTLYYFMWDGVTLGYTRQEDELVVGGCRYVRGARVESWYHEYQDQWIADYGNGITRYCDSVVQTDGRVIIRLNYQTARLFSPWAYNENRYSQMVSQAQGGMCEIRHTVTRTAARPNGCVNSWTSGDGTPNQLCGTDIPVAPFTFLTDRAATRIEMQLQCGNDPDGEAYQEVSNCSRLDNDSQCIYIGRQCSQHLENGDCLVYESSYSCGEQTSYTSPVVTEINICESNLSCLGDDCILNTGTDGSLDLADAAAKLAAADMMMGDMQCEQDLSTAVDRDEAMQGCVLFGGRRETCARRTLGLSNCCDTPSGVGVGQYLQLAFSVSRLSRTVEGSSLANPVTSSWVSMEDLGRNSFSELTRPLTETWESIIGNTGAARDAGNALSMQAVKQEMMKKAAEWTAQLFGEQAANSIFQVAGGDAFVGGVLRAGEIGLSQAAATVMSAVMTAYTIYTIINVVAAILFACTEEEMELGVRRALRSTHEVGEYCSRRILGHCVSRRRAFCMFNSPLSRIMNEQARQQLGRGWGSPRDSDCSGITVAEFQRLDMDQVDLSEWTGMMMSSGMIDLEAVADIDQLTGTGSTYGRALEDLYPREDAITRNTNRYDNINVDDLRKDAVEDFGRGTVR